MGAARRWVRPTAAFLASGLLLLAGLEGWWRVREVRAAGPTLEEVLAGVELPPPGADSRWLHALRPLENPRIAYGLRPGFDGRVDFRGHRARLTVNRHGFRGPDRDTAKAPGALRVVGIGDSYMMGYGIEQEQTYMHLLERHLAELWPERRVELLNLAVGGYNAVQAVEVLRTLGLRFDPDLVLFHLVSNDHHGIQYQGVGPRPWSLDRLRVLDRWRGETLRGRSEAYAGWEHLERALGDLADLHAEHDFELLVFSTEGAATVRRMLAIAEALGLPHADLRDYLPEHVQRLGLRPNVREALSLPGEGHPNALYHRLMAEDLVRTLSERGHLDALADRRDGSPR